MESRVIKSSEVEKLLLDKKCHLIDVREKDEIEEEGRLPYSKNIPLRFIIADIEELDKNLQYVIVCKTGKRSNIAVVVLLIYGYKVLSLEGGIEKWYGEYEKVPEVIFTKKQI